MLLDLLEVIRRLPGPPSPPCWAPSAAAWREHPQDVAGLELDRALVGETFGPGLIPTGHQPVLTDRARLTTGETPRPRHPSLGDQRHGHVFEHEQITLDPLATVMSPSAAAPAP